ncbi:MAG: phage terminase large subunit, partial [Chloroflexi bacterium]|nr:phage terminase large subunit [Chloroflexota bacterium]
MRVQVWRAQPRQAAFLRRTEIEALYGGAAGAGKTDALLVFSIRRRVRHPGSRGLLLRRTYADLNREGAAIARSRELLEGAGVRWTASDHKWRFPNGSVLEFGALETEPDVYKYQGAQYDDICFDELTQFSSFQYRFLMGRTRTVRTDLKPLIRAATNPGGAGHGWVKERFVENAAPLTPFTDPLTGLTRIFVPARLWDNKALTTADPDYERRLLALPEAERRAYLDGDWDVFSGQVFREFRRDRAGQEWHVVRPFAIPAEWRRFRALDFGIGAPMCCLWFARDPAGGVVVYRE